MFSSLNQFKYWRHPFLAISFLLWFHSHLDAQVSHRLLHERSSWCSTYITSDFITSSRPRFQTVTFDFQTNCYWTDIPYGMILENQDVRFIEDTLAGTVKYASVSDTFILYDFNLLEGDTLLWDSIMSDDYNKIHHSGSDKHLMVVTLRDSVTLTDGIPRLRMRLTQFDINDSIISITQQEPNHTWIEGIGDSIGLYYPFMGIGWPVAYYFNAYFWDDSVVWQYRDCYPVGIEENPTTSTIAWPNPTSDYLKVEAAYPIDQLFVVNQNGQQVQALRLLKLKSYVLNAHDWPDGVYSLILVGESNQEVVKVVKVGS